MDKYLILKIKGHNDETVSFRFTEDDKSRLLLFNEKAKQLSSSDIIKSKIPSNFKLKWDKENGTQISWECPNDDLIGTLLHRLRPFLLKREPSFFPTIRNVLNKEINNATIRGFLDYIMDIWDGKALSGVLQMRITAEVDGQMVQTDILTDDFLNKWLNAYEYHSDSDKKRFIEQLHKYYPFEANKTLLVDFLFQKCEAIHRMDQFITLLLNEETTNSLEFPFKINNKI